MGLGRIGRGAHRKLDRRRLLSARVVLHLLKQAESFLRSTGATATSISASVVLLLTDTACQRFC